MSSIKIDTITPEKRKYFADRIIELRGKGKSTKAISNILGISEDFIKKVIRGQYSEAQYKNQTNVSNKDAEEIIRLRDEGHSFSEIAKLTGLSDAVLRRIYDKYTDMEKIPTSMLWERFDRIRVPILKELKRRGVSIPITCHGMV